MTKDQLRPYAQFIDYILDVLYIVVLIWAPYWLYRSMKEGDKE